MSVNKFQTSKYFKEECSLIQLNLFMAERSIRKIDTENLGTVDRGKDSTILVKF